MILPRNATGAPMTYMLNDKQFIVVRPRAPICLRNLSRCVWPDTSGLSSLAHRETEPLNESAGTLTEREEGNRLRICRSRTKSHLSLRWLCHGIRLPSQSSPAPRRRSRSLAKFERSSAGTEFDDVRMVLPAFERYMQGAIMGDLWKRPDPSRRDRSIVTPSCLLRVIRRSRCLTIRSGTG